VYFTGVFVGLARRRPLPGFFPIMVGPEHVRTRSGYRERERGAETMSEIGTANSITIHATAEKFWAAITRPETIKQWFFGVETETDWQVGSPIVHRGEWQGKPCEDKGEIVRLIRLRSSCIRTGATRRAGPTAPRTIRRCRGSSPSVTRTRISR
jgi:hypothetical protein